MLGSMDIFMRLPRDFTILNQSIILGSGIGVTLFSGILTDLQVREDRQREGESPVLGNNSDSTSNGKPSATSDLSEYRRVDFH
jgi:dual oxidase